MLQTYNTLNELGFGEDLRHAVGYDAWEALGSAFVGATLEGTIGIRYARQDKGGAEKLAHEAQATNGKSKRASDVFFPDPQPPELVAVKKSYQDVRVGFNKLTADGRDGMRLRTTAQEIEKSLVLQMQPHLNRLAGDRAAFILALPRIVQDIRDSGARGLAFSLDDYPTDEELEKCFKYELICPIQLGRDAPRLITRELAAAMQEATQRYAERQIQAVQQEAHAELLKYLKPVVVQLSEFVAFKDGLSTDRKKSPKVSESLAANLRDAIARAKTYALPGTPAGDALLALANEIEQELDIDIKSPTNWAEDLKENVPLARATAADATALMASLESLESFF
jgi:hypothetical protein